MTPGAVIAVGAWGGSVAFVAVQLGRILIEDRMWRRDEKRAAAELRAYGGKLPEHGGFTEADLEQLERFRSGVAMVEAFALTLEEIRQLPETRSVGWF